MAPAHQGDKMQIQKMLEETAELEERVRVAMADESIEDDELLGEDDWEDQLQLNTLLKKYPSDWYIVKMVDFNHVTMAEIDDWLSDNMYHKYERVGWHSGCSYSVGVIFENAKDAIFFKLRWR
jgi:hypothetical protein